MKRINRCSLCNLCKLRNMRNLRNLCNRLSLHSLVSTFERKSPKALSVALLLVTLTGCGVQSIPRAKNDVDAALAEVVNQYKRRSDLIPNLVETVKGVAKQEKDVLTQVTEARAKATSVTLDPSNATPEQLKAYSQAQGQLSQALGRLLMVSENYPQLKSMENYRDLQSQLEGTENRITVARQRQIEAIKAFNNLVTVFPTSLTNSLFFKHAPLEQFGAEVSEEERKAPKVNF